MQRLLTLTEVMERLTLGRTAIYKMIRAGKFPAPLKIGERASRWPADVVENWLQDRAREAGHEINRAA
ncbi:MAG: AlpA family phage regulatory protein [Gammaproteobacteria bacterium]|nr:AlpA family phage regulatory protein [Gammaproteobacteria bacterium]